MNPHKELALEALRNMIGDDLYRAECAFAGMTQKQMQEQHGQSGRTRQQIIDGYRQHDRKVREAIQWLDGAQ
jgi:hypothetical protein